MYIGGSEPNVKNVALPDDYSIGHRQAGYQNIVKSSTNT